MGCSTGGAPAQLLKVDSGALNVNLLAEPTIIGGSFPVFIGTVNRFMEKVNRTQEPFVSATLLNGWTSYIDGIRYAKNDLGMVTVNISVHAGNANSIISNIPAGYRPIGNQLLNLFNASTGNLNSSLPILISTDGNISVQTGAIENNVYTESISYAGNKNKKCHLFTKL